MEKRISLLELVRRKMPPVPWIEGEKIPWNEPEFSKRMLLEHLSQAHNAASRRFEIIDQQVQWINQTLLDARPTKILDLACGPGLYMNRMAGLGHTCLGIDFSPASIAYAREQVAAGEMNPKFTLQDIRKADYGEGYGLAMLLFGEFNVFNHQDAAGILKKAYNALLPGGRLLLEPHTHAAVRAIGMESPSWRTHEHGLFSDRPHLYLTENFWDVESQSAIERYVIVDAETAGVVVHSATMLAYSEDDYRQILTQAGFQDVEIYPSMGLPEDQVQQELIVLTARKNPA